MRRSARWAWLTPELAGIIIAMAWLVFGIASMPRYGITTDSPALFWAGDRTLFWATHETLEDPKSFVMDTPPPGFTSDFSRYPDMRDPYHYPVFPGFVAAVTGKIFHDRLGVLDSHHVGLLLLYVFALFWFCVYASRLFGREAGIASTVVLAIFPAAVGHAFNNAKDWPCAMFYALTILAAGVGVIERRARPILAAGIFAGLSLACKMNGAFAIATLMLWAPIAYLLAFRRRRVLPARVAGPFVAIPYIAGAVFYVLWPWLWKAKSLSVRWDHLQDYLTFIVHYGVGEREWWTAYPVRCLLYTTPPLVLFLAAAYVLVGWRGDGAAKARWSLVMLWFLIPLVRTAMPRSNFYDANRHFIEYVPALCVMAGVGAVTLARIALPYVRDARARVGAVAVAAIAACAILVWPVVVYHPFETTYFNVLIGGLGGAQRRQIYTMPPPHDWRVNGTEGDYWNSSLRDAFRRIYIATPHSDSSTLTLATCVMAVGDTAATVDWPSPNKPRVGAPEVADYIVIIPRQSFCPPPRVAELEQDRPLIARVEREGGVIYEIVGPRRSPFAH